ncbi:DUF1993 domain-containing protein [Pseudomonas mangiferae]|uniref:DUF1993 domain-containing protein n=1 Tax=Pseudomonas mangiferae TaxID=2593654 RepID=A0A553H524_9PSED|nr:DUF1993 domain-containing protein [Pseudomonas mangiferae]TRX76804.1 DUF1993 domain-containing protein [Pseudomonas mangiferae]
MSLSMYPASIPVFVRMLRNLSALLAKAEAHAQARKIDPAVFLQARLAPDMYPLVRQVQVATDLAKGCAARLTGSEAPRYADTETTFAELQARLQRVTDYLEGIEPSQVDGTEEREIVLEFPGVRLEYKGQGYLLNFAMPNFYFHVTTAYAILRHLGVEIGKVDFVGRE